LLHTVVPELERGGRRLLYDARGGLGLLGDLSHAREAVGEVDALDALDVRHHPLLLLDANARGSFERTDGQAADVTTTDHLEEGSVYAHATG
jgi:hypothetical protein